MIYEKGEGRKLMNRTKIFAHRGASGYAPENTIEAFQLAIEQGADGIELDVQLTADGVPVVIHDEKIDRVTDGKGFVKDYTLKELRQYTVYSKKFEVYKEARIPTLEEVLELIRPSNIQVNIELKTGIIWYPDIERKTVELVKKNGMEDRIIYSSFNHYSVQRLREIVPDAETAYLYSDVILKIDEYAKKTGVDGIHPAVYHVKMDNFLEEYLNSKLKIRVWTVNRKKDMRDLMTVGIEAIITNYPDKAVAIRAEIEK